MGRPRKERYARLMGGFWRNEKIRRLSLEARGLLATAWSYAADQATDGRIPVELLAAWAGKRQRALMAELTGGERPFLTVASGAVDAEARDWTDVNITAAEWEAKLEADRKRKKPGSKPFPPGNPGGFPTGNGPEKSGPGCPAAAHGTLTPREIASSEVPGGERAAGAPDEASGSPNTSDPPKKVQVTGPVSDRKPGGSRADFQRVALDEDEDEEDLQADVVVGSGPGSRARPPHAPTTGALRALHATEAASEAADASHSDRMCLVAAGAYGRALEAAGAIFDGATAWRSSFVAIGRIGERVAQRDSRELREVLTGWATRYVAERRSRRPDWWLERVTAWAAEDTAQTTAPATARRLEAEDAGRAERWAAAEREAVPPPEEARELLASLGAGIGRSPDDPGPVRAGWPARSPERRAARDAAESADVEAQRRKLGRQAEEIRASIERQRVAGAGS